MPRITSYGKIRAAAFLVRRIHRRIRTLVKMRARRRHHVSAGRKADHPNLVRIDLPLGGVKSHQPQRPLRIFQRQR